MIENHIDVLAVLVDYKTVCGAGILCHAGQDKDDHEWDCSEDFVHDQHFTPKYTEDSTIVVDIRQLHSLTWKFGFECNRYLSPIAALGDSFTSHVPGPALRRPLFKLAVKWVRHMPFRKDTSITRLSVNGTDAERTVRA